MPRTTLGIDIRNPYASLEKTMTVSSDPITHHRVAGGDFAIDINMPGIQNAGETAVFDIVATGNAREARGIVLRGEGKTFLACKSGDFDQGGCGVQIRLEARARAVDRWRAVGTYSLLHLEELLPGLKPGVEVKPGDQLGEASGRFGGECSSGPHLHLEAASKGRATIPMVRFGDRLSESTVIFSVALVTGNDLPGPESAASSLSEAAFAARSLSEFYEAMGRTLPSLAVRGQIYDALGLGLAAAYRGAPDQNAGLLKALKARGIAPRSAADVT